MNGSKSAAESITRLIGGLHATHGEVKNLLEEVGNGSEERSQIAVDTLNNLPGVSKELLASIMIATHIDQNVTVLYNLKKEHDRIHNDPDNRGCSALRFGFERMEKMFFRGVCVCLGVPLILWIIMMLGEHYFTRK